MSANSLESSVPDWVIDHPETLALFQELGIDYSCGGKSLEFACRERGLPVLGVLARLQEVINNNHPSSSSPGKDHTSDG